MCGTKCSLIYVGTPVVRDFYVNAVILYRAYDDKLVVSRTDMN